MLLSDLFAKTAARHPGLPAIDVPAGRDGRRRVVVSYAELAVMADAVRSRLAQLVVGECTVAVLLPRATPWLCAAQLGVLQAGAAHVCLDPSLPLLHMQHVVRDSGAIAIVTDAAGAATLADLGVPIVLVPSASPPSMPPPTVPPPTPPRCAWQSEHSLAYLIYTSGTTGLSKGVLLEHAGAVNLIEQGVLRFGLGPGDRIAQGSSAAYDSSIEEIWLALASGATVVVLDDDTVRLGPDLVPWLRQERITVLCPPPTLLRAIDCRSPRDELPDLRLCYVGGETLPQDLADLWGEALWLENGYGPTECTVTVVRGRVPGGRPVSIGTPVPPHRALLLDERLQPVADGVAGELCIAGPGVARGYLGLPELTAARFPTLPGIGRVYRTGDLARRTADGALTCLGRIDAQVKLRGHRIELEAIEAVLARCPGVREVACRVQGDGPAMLLAAHIVPELATSPPATATLQDAVRAVLPSHMVPARFSVLPALPRSIGGKVDRKALPAIDGEQRDPNVAAPAPPASAGQRRLLAAFAAVLHVPATGIGVDDDFFALGGDSLRAALLVSRLRRDQGHGSITVRDVYAARTVAALAARSRRREATAPPAPRRAPPARTAARARPLAMTAMQCAFLLLLLATVATIGYWLAFVLVPWLLMQFSLGALLPVAPAIAAVGLVVHAGAMLGLAVLAKHLLIGRYQPLRVPAWSSFHARHWIVVRMVRLVPWSLLQGTTLQLAALRALGARIGRRVHIHRDTDLLGGGWDLLDIGDDATLAREVVLGLCEFDDGDLVVGAVRIGNGATLEVRAGTGIDVDIGAGAIVRALSFVPDGSSVPAGEEWDGVPAQRVGTAAPPPVVDGDERHVSPGLYSVILPAARVLLPPLQALPFALTAWLAAKLLGLDAQALAAWLCVDGPWSHAQFVALALALAVLTLPLSLALRAALLRCSPKVPAGTHHRWSFVHLRLQLRSEILEAAGTWLSGTLFWPWWLRLAGMRIGKGCEVSTILDALPEHVQIGTGSFLADGIYLGVPHQQRGTVTVLPTALGERTFLGNHAVVAAGQALPADVLLGVCTTADAARMDPGTAWFGHPAFLLPRREVVSIDRRLTHTPGPVRYANRLFWESLRMALPALPLLLLLWWFEVVAAATGGSFATLAATVTLATLAYGAALAAVVLVLKWLLLGRVRPGQHGLWSCWASRWDFHYVVWNQYGRALLSQLEGTLLLPWFLRAMGMRIGRRAVLGDGFAQVVDPDMLSIGDGATVHAMFQAHSFEDRVLKIDRVHLGKRCTVGRGAVVLYGAEIGDGAQVAPHSVVMKGELLLPHHRYDGAPTEEVAATAHAAPTAVPPG